MKEISIEEKARRYDEAKYIMKEYLESGNAGVIAENTIKKAFPELAESDDERIRKSLAAYFTKFKPNDMWDADFSFGDIVAWLEKQGEPIDRIVKRATTEKQRVLLTETNGDANIDWDTRSLQDVKLLLEYGLDYIKKLEKQGEQKSAEMRETKPKDISEFLNRLTTVEQDFLWEHIAKIRKLDKKEQNPDWSEDDENHVKSILSTLEYCKARLQLAAGSYSADIEWLKSLRPQPQWKPSEEMLKALYKVIPKNVMAISEDEMLLDKLYQGLKYGRVLSKN